MRQIQTKTQTILKTAFLSSGLFFGSVLAADLPNFTALIKKNAPTVVQIDTRLHSNERSLQGQQIAPEDLLRYFFEGPGQPRPRLQERRQPSHGSGFFIDSSGYILTNAHVVNGSDEIIVSTTDQTEYVAELIGMDEHTDIALLKIKKEGLPAATIGDSDKIEVGNWVLAIGSPYGFDYTATKGIISAVSRSLPDGTYVPFIQTDAAVNPGNSGGPLFNLDGEVIGINSQIYSRTGAFNGLAFAVPINTAMRVAEQLKSKGFVSRGWLGVAIQNIDQDLAKSFGLEKPHGALVSNITEDSPAEKAGIMVGDIILQFNGKKIIKSSALPPMVGTVAAGTAIEIILLRNGKNKTLSVIIGELEDNNVTDKGTPFSNNYGLSVTNLTQRQKEILKADNGVLVRKVSANSRAAEAGFRSNDIIVRVNNTIIEDVKTFEAIMDASNATPGMPLAVLVIRQGRSLFIPL